MGYFHTFGGGLRRWWFKELVSTYYYYGYIYLDLKGKLLAFFGAYSTLEFFSFLGSSRVRAILSVASPRRRFVVSGVVMGASGARRTPLAQSWRKERAVLEARRTSG